MEKEQNIFSLPGLSQAVPSVWLYLLKFTLRSRPHLAQRIGLRPPLSHNVLNTALLWVPTPTDLPLLWVSCRRGCCGEQGQVLTGAYFDSFTIRIGD